MNKPRGTPAITPSASPKNTLRNESQICPEGMGMLNALNSQVAISKTVFLKLGLTFPSGL